MVGFQQLRDAAIEPLTNYADYAKKLATEFEQFAGENDRQKRVLTSAWSGADATAAANTLTGQSRDYTATSAQYGKVDKIVTRLAGQLKSAKQALESAIAMAPSIPGSVGDNGAITVNYAALGPNPSQAAVQAAQNRAKQVHGQLAEAIRQATQADQQAQTELAGIAAVAEKQSGQNAKPDAEATKASVGGLTKAQLANADTIIEVGKKLGISEKGQAIALATAMQESKFKNLANSKMPESLKLPNEGTGKDHDSVGLFQQRPSVGWGSIAECMDPQYSATAFYKELKRVRGWEDMELTKAAQSVQRSAYPNAYAQWETLAYQILKARK